MASKLSDSSIMVAESSSASSAQPPQNNLKPLNLTLPAIPIRSSVEAAFHSALASPKIHHFGSPPLQSPAVLSPPLTPAPPSTPETRARTIHEAPHPSKPGALQFDGAADEEDHDDKVIEYERNSEVVDASVDDDTRRKDLENRLIDASDHLHLSNPAATATAPQGDPGCMAKRISEAEEEEKWAKKMKEPPTKSASCQKPTDLAAISDAANVGLLNKPLTFGHFLELSKQAYKDLHLGSEEKYDGHPEDTMQDLTREQRHKFLWRNGSKDSEAVMDLAKLYKNHPPEKIPRWLRRECLAVYGPSTDVLEICMEDSLFAPLREEEQNAEAASGGHKPSHAMPESIFALMCSEAWLLCSGIFAPLRNLFSGSLRGLQSQMKYQMAKWTRPSDVMVFVLNDGDMIFEAESKFQVFGRVRKQWVYYGPKGTQIMEEVEVTVAEGKVQSKTSSEQSTGVQVKEEAETGPSSMRADEVIQKL